MTQTPQSEAADTETKTAIVLPEPDGGYVQVPVSTSVYRRYDELRGRSVLTKEQLARLATHDGAAALTAESVVAVLGLSEDELMGRLTELNQAAAAVQGSILDSVTPN